MKVEFNPLRSLIFIRCAREEYRHRLRHWLYRIHVPDSISQFAPYVIKYAYYPAFPPPPGSEAFGAHNVQLTEHYWLIEDPHLPKYGMNKTLQEYFPPDVLRWQGNIPDVESGLPANLDATRARGTNCAAADVPDDNVSPFVFAFVPLWWEEDFKGAGRTVEDGPNYRWLLLLKYPDGVSAEEGDKWFYDAFVPAWKSYPETVRFLSSRVKQDVNGCPFQRCVELWFNGPDEWESAVKRARSIPKPAWASVETFPYLKRFGEIVCLFLGDIAESNHLAQYQGYYTMR
jgi:hypothetical protein